MRIHSIICAVLIVGGAACASSQREEVRDARNAQVDEQTVAKTRVIEDRQQEREDSIEQKADVATTQIENSGGDKAAGSDEIVGVVEDRASYESDVRARWETIGVRINAAEEKMHSLGRKAPAKFQTELKSLAKEHDSLKEDVANVRNIPAASWEKATDTLDERLGKLNERVKDLTDSIEAS